MKLLRIFYIHIVQASVKDRYIAAHIQDGGGCGILLRDPLTASYFVAVWKMLRKKGCVPSALTQNVKDLLASREIENILDNTDFMVLLSQAQSDRAILAKQLGISEHQLSYITHSNSGEGLLFYGNVTIPFVDRFPRGEIYDLLTTRPEDLAHERTDE